MEKGLAKKKIFSGFMWKLVERFANQGITLIVTLVLSRLLGPEEYTRLAIINIFITIADVFVQSGLSTALIQKKEEPDEKDYSAVFFMSLIVAGGFYVTIVGISPVILGMFNYQNLVLPLAVTALVLFFGAFTSVQNAIVARKMEFKKIFISCLVAGSVSGTLAVVAALLNFGIWALVIHFTVNRILTFVMLLIMVKWRPVKSFSPGRLRSLFGFGWKVMISSLIDAVYQDIRSFSIKLKYETNEAALGLYNRGQQVPQTLVTSINGAVSQVMLPALSSYQTDREKMKYMVKRAITSCSFVVYPMMAGLAVMAAPLVQIILGEEWLPCIPILQIYCLNYIFWPTHSANLQAINALGKSNVYLIAEIIKKAFDIGILALSLIFFEDLTFIAWGSVISNLISAVINAWPNKKYINYGFFAQCRDVLPNILLSAAMALVVYLLGFIPLNLFILTPLRIAAGIVVYFGLAVIFKNRSFRDIMDMLKTLTGKGGKVK